MKYNISFLWIFWSYFTNSIVQKENILILCQLFEELIIMIEKKVNYTHVLLCIVKIHESKFQKFTFLFVKTK